MAGGNWDGHGLTSSIRLIRAHFHLDELENNAWRDKDGRPLKRKRIKCLRADDGHEFWSPDKRFRLCRSCREINGHGGDLGGATKEILASKAGKKGNPFDDYDDGDGEEVPSD